MARATIAANTHDRSAAKDCLLVKSASIGRVICEIGRRCLDAKNSYQSVVSVAVSKDGLRTREFAADHRKSNIAVGVDGDEIGTFAYL